MERHSKATSLTLLSQSFEKKIKNFIMNPLALLPLLAAAAMAAPGAHHVLLNQPAQVVVNQPAITYSQVQVPLTQTVHYESRPVVTGYSTTVVKPAIAAAPLPGINQIAFAQLPELTPPPNDQFPTPAPPNGTDLPVTPPAADAPTLPPLTPPTQAPPSENGTSGDQGGNPTLPIPGSPILGIPNSNLIQFVNPAQLQLSSLVLPQPLAVQHAVVQQPAVVQAAAVQPAAVVQPANDAVVVEARAAVPVQTVAAVRAAQAGDFEPLVTKEKVLAPVRTHTQITPQYTQIQPEITVRKVVHEVPVATPVAVQTPVVHHVQQVHQVQHVQQVHQVQHVQQVATALHGAQIVHAA